MIFCWFHVHSTFFENGSALNGKNLLPLNWEKYFPFRVNPFQKGGKTQLTVTASDNAHPFALNIYLKISFIMCKLCVRNKLFHTFCSIILYNCASV